MEYTSEELLEAERQLESTVHKLREVIKTLEGKGDPARYKSQLTLARRRVDAFTLALSLVERELDEKRQEGGMEYIDQSAWARREAFELFSQVEFPFYSVTIPVDVTRVKKVAGERGVSFYHLMIWLCVKAVNSVPQFRLRVRGEQVVRLDRADPSYTTLRKGSEQFQIITLPWMEDLSAFCQAAREKEAGQTAFLEQEKETDGLVYLSCTPWFDFTALTNEHNLNRDDTIPRLTWGRYDEREGRLWVHLSIEVNHRLIDGLHLGQLKEALDREIEAL